MQLNHSQELRQYLFHCLSEECGEVVQVLGKIGRFGENDFHPKTGSIPNIELLSNELNDLFSIAAMLGWEPNLEANAAKVEKVLRYFEYAKKGGNHGNTGRESQSQG
jgi:hypothetical protein